MTTYTYEDFEKSAREAGLYDRFSAADLNLAKSNPDAGMGILQYKKDYSAATTDEARALANAGAEKIRSQYGNYTGGSSGSGYYLNGPDPAGFSYSEAPTYTNPYADQTASALGKLTDRDAYQSKYDDMIAGLLGGITNQQPFQYDPDSDPAMAAYTKQYRREGQRATADTLGQAATMSGGIPSTAAMTAASQAGDYYAAQLADKIPELAQQAYARRQGEFANQLAALGQVQSLEQGDYQKFMDNIGLDQNALAAIMSLSDADYQKFRDALGQYNADRGFGYNQYLDTLNWDRDQDIYDQAQKNYEKEQALAASQYNRELEHQRAIAAAQMGDYSLFKKLWGQS